MHKSQRQRNLTKVERGYTESITFQAGKNNSLFQPEVFLNSWIIFTRLILDKSKGSTFQALFPWDVKQASVLLFETAIIKLKLTYYSQISHILNNQMRQIRGYSIFTSPTKNSIPKYTTRLSRKKRVDGNKNIGSWNLGPDVLYFMAMKFYKLVLAMWQKPK